ncbi:ribonuclease H-like domain-containing protein [Tanacetum coccineum]
MSGTHDEIPPPPPPPQETQQKPTQQTPQTVSTIKLPILKKGEYDIWAMKIEHYLAHTDYPIWEVIQNGNGPVSVTLDTTGQIKILPPKTAEEMVLRERERKARTTLLMAIPEDHLAKFHKMTDAKDMWIAIKSRFGGNDESKKMQKYILKQQFEGFTVSNSDGIHKGYERFQSLLSQLEIHGAGVSTEDANQKFLRSLPSAWLQVSLIMRNKPGMDSLSFDDLYNNLRVFENDVKGSTASSSNLQNIAFVSENTNSTNEVSTAYGVSHSSGHCLKHEQPSTSSYSLLASQSSCPQLDHEDLDQVDEYDLEEMDLKWQVAMISMRINKFQKKTGRKLQFDAKEPVGFDKTKVECFKCHKTGHFARECRTKEENRRRDGWNTGNREGRRTSNRDESISLLVSYHRTLSSSYRLSNLGGYPKWRIVTVISNMDTTGQIKILPPKTAEKNGALRVRERKARTTLLFGGNDESKKMQKYILKQQFEGFTVSNSDGIHKGYERFQSLLSQLEIHERCITEDDNQKFLRSSTFCLVTSFLDHEHEQPSTSSYSLLASQSSCPQLDHEDLDQVDEYDLEVKDAAMKG